MLNFLQSLKTILVEVNYFTILELSAEEPLPQK